MQNKKLLVVRILSVNNPNIETSLADDIEIGLSSVLNLSIGTPVMLKINYLWIKGKLSNGSMGTIKHIVYSPGTKPPVLPSYLLIQFDNYKGPYLRDKYIPIITIQRSWDYHGLTYTRM